jgi:DNA-binding CsgD family transcriptional regulator
MATAAERSDQSSVNRATAVSTADRSMQYVLDRHADGPRRHDRISDAIRTSWRRSANAGLIPNEIRAPYDSDIDGDGLLRWAAAPTMAAVSSDLAAVEVALLLTDDRGHVIERWASASTASAMDHIGAAPGFVCEEAVVGTNSIGGALRTRRPSVVLGFEHFADGLTEVSCAARAVTDPVTKQVLGVVNMTCAGSAYSAVIPALIGRVVHETQQRLIGDCGVTASALHAVFVQTRRRAKGPIAVLDGRSMFVNSSGASIVQPADRAVLWAWAQPLLGTPSGRATSVIELSSGIQEVRCDAVYDGDFIAGAVVWLGTTGGPVPTLNPMPDSAAGLAMLTGAERSIAEHVANGLTNRETASVLFISAHTVDYHLRQIFRKLELRSRVELARVVADAEVRPGG